MSVHAAFLVLLAAVRCCSHGFVLLADRRPHTACMQAVDAADLSLLPGLFRALEQDFGVGPKGLASLVLSQSILKGLAYPAWCAQRPAVWLTGSLPPHTATLSPFGV
eukprot:COSAG06_NODE_23293_length_696_cov_4.005025_1_plen_107_part_00